MKSKNEYTDESMGKLKVINDVLPPPIKLDFKKAKKAIALLEEIDKQNIQITPQLMKKDVAKKIRSFRGKLKWSGDLDEMRLGK